MAYCSDCEREFPHDAALDQHYANSKSHSYCKPCERLFKSWAARRQHWETSVAHRYNYCSECEELFEDGDARWEHKKDDRNHHPHLCIPCRLECSEAVELHEHFKNAEEHRYTYCVPCQQHFSSREDRWEHVKTSSNHPHICYQCRLDFRGPIGATNLQDHFSTVESHRETYCETCGVNFDTREDRFQHMGSSSNHPYLCLQCRLEFKGPTGRSDMQTHFRTAMIHQGTYCEPCEINFDSQEARWEHVRNRKDLHPYSCIPCRLEWSGDFGALGLKGHIQTAAVHADIYCQICQNIFSSPNNLREVIIRLLVSSSRY